MKIIKHFLTNSPKGNMEELKRQVISEISKAISENNAEMIGLLTGLLSVILPYTIKDN